MRSPTSSTTRAPAASTRRQHRARQRHVEHQRAPGPRPVSATTSRAATSGTPGGAPPRAESTAQPSSAGSTGTQGLRRHPPADVPQVVPPPPGQVLDARGHLEATAQQVEVDDDGRRPGRREPAADGEGEGARAEATGGPDDGGHAGVGRHPGQPRRHPPPGARVTTSLWTTRPRRQPPVDGGRGDPVRGAGDERTKSGHGTAPVGGTTGAVGEPSSGGEKPVRRSLNPEGERVSPSCPSTGSARKPWSRHVDIAAQRASISHGIRRFSATPFNL